MKRALQDKITVWLAPCFRLFDALGRLFKFGGLARSVRQAYWKAKLSELGAGSVLYPSVVIHCPAKVHVGLRSSIAEFTHIWGHGGVIIGNDVLIASHVVITSLTHDKHAASYRGSVIKAPVSIENNVWIGSGAIIMPGVTIGANSIVGAGAVVTKDVPRDTIVTGIPARVAGQHSNAGSNA